MRTILLPLVLGIPMLTPFFGALVQPVDPADDLALMLRQPWRWRLQHPILAMRRRVSR